MQTSSFLNLNYHLIWATKNKQPLILPHVEENLYRYIGEISIAKKFHLFAVGGVYDHIHLLLQDKENYGVSELACCIKANSSRYMRENFDSSFAWQKGYGAFSVSRYELDHVRNYIAGQKAHHNAVIYEDELNVLLGDNRIK